MANIASEHAGALHVQDSTLWVDGSLLGGNRAGQNGGVIYASHSLESVSIVVSHSRFINNRAGGDGGVLYAGQLGSLVIIRESSFELNAATERGGVMAVLGSRMDISGTNFSDSTAKLGNVIYSCISDITVQNQEALVIAEDPTNSLCTLYDTNTSLSGVSITTDFTPTINVDSNCRLAATLYGTLGVSIIVFILVLVLYVILLCLILYFCMHGTLQCKKKMPVSDINNPYLYVPMSGWIIKSRLSAINIKPIIIVLF